MNPTREEHAFIEEEEKEKQEKPVISMPSFLDEELMMPEETQQGEVNVQSFSPFRVGEFR